MSGKCLGQVGSSYRLFSFSRSIVNHDPIFITNCDPKKKFHDDHIPGHNVTLLSTTGDSRMATHPNVKFIYPKDDIAGIELFLGLLDCKY